MTTTTDEEEEEINEDDTNSRSNRRRVSRSSSTLHPASHDPSRRRLRVSPAPAHAALHLPPTTADLRPPQQQQQQQQQQKQQQPEVWTPPTPPRPLERRLSWGGLLLMLAFLAATSYYLYVRASVTLHMGSQTPYAAFVFAVEIMGLAAVLPYAAMLVVYTAPTGSPGLPADDKSGRLILPEDKRFHVRVLIPCYKEPLGVIKNTVNAALGARLPPGVQRTVYLCDDGNDAEKSALMGKLWKQGGRYVTGRQRRAGEINGKSANLNNCLKNVIYREYIEGAGEGDPNASTGAGGMKSASSSWGGGAAAAAKKEAAARSTGGGAAVSGAIPPQELIVVFDPDMAATPPLFRGVHEVMWEDSVGLCLTPQKFRNVEPNADIFNNANNQFWNYVLPGCDALGYVACTGTNFCIRACAMAKVGWFPEYTITEDYALSMELKMAGVKGAYLSDYLAVGEAPTEVRNVCRQRSRWTKGHMQIFFSWDKCPLLQWRLSLLHKLLYTNGTYAYFATIATSIVFTLVPFVSLLFGLHPVAFSRPFAIAATVYLPVNCAVQSFARERAHLRGQFFASVSSQVLCFTYIKAVFNTLLSKVGLKQRGGFKPTNKAGPIGGGGQKQKQQQAQQAQQQQQGTGGGGQQSSSNGGGVFRLSALWLPTGKAFGPLGPVKLEKSTPGGVDEGEGGGCCWWFALNAKTLEGALDPLFLALSLGVSAVSIAAGLASLALKGGGRQGGLRSRREFAELFSLSSSSSSSSSPGRLIGVYTLVPVLWAAYNAVPPVLFFIYFFNKGRLLNYTAAVCQGLTLAFGAAAIACLWILAPEDDGPFDPRDVLPAAAAFLDAQRSGHPEGTPLPAAANLLYNSNNNNGNSQPALDLRAFGPAQDAVPGGFYMGADYVKHSFPLATSLTTLSWSLLTFGAGFAAAGTRGKALLDAAAAAAAAGTAANSSKAAPAPPWAASAASTARGVVRHAARYLIDCHTSDFEFVVRQGRPADYVIEVERGGWGLAYAQGVPAAPLIANASLLAASGGGGGGGEFRSAYNASTGVRSARGFWGPPKEAPPDRRVARLTLSSAGGADALAAASAALASASLALRLPPLRGDPTADPLSSSSSSSSSSPSSLLLYPTDEDAPDAALADKALRHARKLYTFALALQAFTKARPPRGTPPGGTPSYCAAVGCHQGRPASEGGGYRWLAFPSSSCSDDLALAAAWLHRATGVGGFFLEDARAHLWRHLSVSGEARLSDPRYYAPGDNSAFSAAILLGGEVDAEAPPAAAAQRYRDALTSFARAWMAGRAPSGAPVTRTTPKGLAYLDSEGSPLPTALEAAHLCLQAAAAVRRQQQQRGSKGAFASLPKNAAANLECFARRQVQYALGGGLGKGRRSFVVGIGNDPPERPMHRQASCRASSSSSSSSSSSCDALSGLLSPDPNPVTLTGAVVAGPDADDAFPDDRAEPSSAVGFHLQAPFVAALAALSAPGPARDRSSSCERGAATGGVFAAMMATVASGGGEAPAPDPLEVGTI